MSTTPEKVRKLSNEKLVDTMLSFEKNIASLLKSVHICNIYILYISFLGITVFLFMQALRILLQAISTSATRHSRYIEPLISVSVDFYIRVYLKVHYGPRKANLSAR